MTVREYIKDNPDVTIANIIMSSHNNPEDHSIVELTVC